MRTLCSLIIQPILIGTTFGQIQDPPLMNGRIVAYVNDRLGKQVGRGECWDLAAAALNDAGAEWDGGYGFGRPLNPVTDTVLPGDIVQFEGVELRWQQGKAMNTARMPHHTAVVLEAPTPDSLIIGEQNTRELGRKVGRNELVLSRRTKGTISFFRPIEPVR